MLLFVTIIWASSFPLIKMGLKEIPPITFATVRFLVASAFLLLAFSLTSELSSIKHIPAPDWVRLLVLGITGIGLLSIFQFIGLSYTTAISASILLATNPIFITIFSAAFLQERIDSDKVAGILIAFLGVTFIVTKLELTTSVFSSESFLGDILILGSALSWAVNTVVGKSMFKTYSPITITVVSISLGSLLLFAFTLFHEDIGTLTQISAAAWVNILYLALVCSGLAYFLWYKALALLEASKAGVFLFTIPVYTMLIANLTLGEAITIPMVVGAALVIVGVYLAGRGRTP